MSFRRSKTAPCLIDALFNYDPRDVSNNYPHPSFPPTRCTHVYVLADRSFLPPLDKRPDTDTLWTIAAVCQICRCHLFLAITFQAAHVPCPNREYPLHHFSFAGQELDHSFFLKCTSSECGAKLTVLIRQPVLTQDEVFLLTDRNALAVRLQQALKVSSNAKFSEPVVALNNLRQFVEDSLGHGKPERVPAENTRFLSSLGSDVSDLLKRLGFDFVEHDAETSRAYWYLPKPSQHDRERSEWSFRAMLEDVRDELLILIHQRPDSELKILKSPPYLPPPANKDIERTLGSLDYDRCFLPKRRDLIERDDRAYEYLGAKADFSDSLIAWAYDRQVLTDPGDANLYLQNLKEIADIRKSEVLETKAVMTESQTYVSQVEVETYQQALEWLGADVQTPDDFIPSLRTAKVADDPANSDLARQAVEIVARERNSQYLRAYLTEDEVPTTQDDLHRSYHKLGISPDLDDFSIVTKLTGPFLDTHADPLWKQELSDSLEVVARARGSDILTSFLRSNGSQAPSFSANQVHIRLEEPRGLQNIGNTCYLNSLLQYFFTVRPLRELVENLDQIMESVERGTLLNKRVGGLQVRGEEVLRAQKFAKQLNKLFQELITAKSTVVTPETELARLTLVNVVNEMVRAQVRRRSTIAAERPLLFNVENVAETPRVRKRIEQLDNNGTMDMVENSQTQKQQQVRTVVPEAAQSVDEMSQMELTCPVGQPGSSDEMLLGDSEKVREAFGTNYDDVSSEDPMNVDHSLAGAIPPTIPPRPQTPVEEWAKQQDPRELIQNVLHQLRWAIRPDRLESDGESVEIISRLFYGKDNDFTVQDDPAVEANWSLPTIRASWKKSATQVVAREASGGEVTADASLKKTDAMKDMDETNQGQSAKALLATKIGVRKSAVEVTEEEPKAQPFYEIFVYVTTPRDIYEAIDRSLDREEVLRPNQPSLFKYRTIEEMPTILQVTVQRNAWLDGNERRVDNQLRLLPMIYMDRYLARDAMFAKRRQSWAWTAEIETLEARKANLITTNLGMELPEALDHVQEYLLNLTKMGEELGVDLDFAGEEELHTLSTFASNIRENVADINNRIGDLLTKREALFANDHELPYHLHAVFVHRGTQVRSGHYFIYIYDSNTEKWRRYNDEDVETVTDLDQIFAPHPDSHEVSTCMIYVKDQEKPNVIQTVCRHPEPQKAFEIADPGASEPLVQAQGSWDSAGAYNVNGW